MQVETWLAYVVAATVVLIIPGPTILLVISQAVTHGKKSAMPLVLGVAAGDLIAMVLSLAGLGLIMSTSAELFSLFKWMGALYLLYLGWSMWKEKLHDFKPGAPIGNLKRYALFRQAFTVTVFNPKGIVFFLAFLPQFVDPQLDRLLQLIILGGTFVTLGAINASAYALLAARIQNWIQTPKAKRVFNRTGGSALICAGLVTASIEQG